MGERVSFSPRRDFHSLRRRNQSEFFQANVLQKGGLPEILDTFGLGQGRYVADAISNRPFTQTQVHSHGNDNVRRRSLTLIQQLDKPADSKPPVEAAEYKFSDPADEARVFYLAPTSSAMQLMMTVKEIRTVTDVKRIFYCSLPQAIAMRGTAGQMAEAAKILNRH